ncbi:hypothetical protein [Ornithinimicrobium cavernae]|uniref:hypothetical protein n=1 Tax=Ornithinimicrobium cavernae TaxID=2666047 RepID=UPI000D69ED28|nr:hypothetical protein [Ornithinimicrobium cavernae]
MTGSPQPVSPEPRPGARHTRANKRQAWLYIVIGVVLGAVAVLGLLGDDRGVLDWLLLVLGVINLVIGVLALRRPEPRLGDAADGGNPAGD